MSKIALCAIGRMENRYAREFVYHYKALGFDRIFIYDNNFGNEEHFEQIAPIVEIVNWRDVKKGQRKAYADCYDKHGQEYDWIAFFDFDEFLVIPNGEGIHEYMVQFEGFDCLLVNWKVMTDNNLVRYEDKPMMERFTTPMPFDKCVQYDFPDNNHVKCIVRGGLSGVSFFKNPHCPSTPIINCCNTKAMRCEQSPFVPYDFSNGYIKHFTTKTIEEWMMNKVVRAYPDGNTKVLRQDPIGWFFARNERTKEKMEWLKTNKYL